MFPAEAEKTALDERLVNRLDDAVADQMFAAAQWYLKRGDPVSARFTFRRLLRKHPNSPAASDALQIMENRGWIESAPAESATEPQPSPEVNEDGS